MFDEIGFPANIKSNNSLDLFDCYRIYNKQDFFFIYDMSDSKTLLLQECFESSNNIRIFVVGKEKLFLNYELHKSPKERYSTAPPPADPAVLKKIDQTVKTISKELSLDMFIIDIAVNNENEVYLLNINPFNNDIDNLFLPEDAYS